MAPPALHLERRSPLPDPTRQPAPNQRTATKRPPKTKQQQQRQRHGHAPLQQLQPEQPNLQLAISISNRTQLPQPTQLQQRLDQNDRGHHSHRAASSPFHGTSVRFQNIQLQSNHNHAKSSEFFGHERSRNANHRPIRRY